MRRALEQDLAEIVAIYNSTIASRQSTADTEEVSVAAKQGWFLQHHPEKTPLYVHEEEGRVVAWVSFQAFYGRPAYAHTAEISLYIATKCRGKGLGKALLQEALVLASKCEIKTLLAFIFSHNTASIRLFLSQGFSEWGKLPHIAEMDGKEYNLSIFGKRLQS